MIIKKVAQKSHEHSIHAYVKVKCVMDHHPKTVKTTFAGAHLAYFGTVIIEGHGIAAIAAGIMFFVTTVQSVWGHEH